ncbi:hypothetical protein [Nocardia sp. NPDC052566]|uniref:hypothetical protein n=1 Tax=Nocardia sp. NPDC052566 TaxID=3364330 RepID=UPI0037C69EC8
MTKAQRIRTIVGSIGIIAIAIGVWFLPVTPSFRITAAVTGLLAMGTLIFALSQSADRG